ncbi:hypothetical protein BC829DRAFT_444908 [Chytridium lagenaria]|nr:hypothetical protein BC829DRAFT_444908 [Chytridium lagenaria]
MLTSTTTATTLLLLASTASLIAAQANAPQLNLCNPNVLPAGWEPGKVTAPLIQESQFQKLNPAAGLQCSGTVVILDGCTFIVRDFTFGGALQTRWYGGVVGTDASGAIVENDLAVNFAAQDVIPSNSLTSQNYTLIRDPVVAYSFLSINQLRVYDLVNEQRICRAELPNQNPRAPGSGGGATTGTASVAAVPTTAAGQTTKTSGGVMGVLGSGIAVAVSLVIAAFTF